MKEKILELLQKPEHAKGLFGEQIVVHLSCGLGEVLTVLLVLQLLLEEGEVEIVGNGLFPCFMVKR